MKFLPLESFLNVFVSQKASLRRIALVLALITLLPTAFYTVYEFSSLNDNEQVLSEMYNRQLDAILYSINDYATLIMTNWANRVSKIFDLEPWRDRVEITGNSAFAKEMSALLSERPCIQQLISDSTGKGFFASQLSPLLRQRVDAAAWDSALQRNVVRIARLPRYLRSDYRKLEPLFMGDSSSPNTQVLIVFAMRPAGPHNLMGIVLDDEKFVRNVLARKLAEIAGENFVLAVIQKKADTLVYATSSSTIQSLRQRKKLWLFPAYDLGIRLQGTTIDELASARTRRNLLLLLMLDGVLLAGAWFVYRSVRREMELVRVKSDFVSNVSHELRTPLALIRMFGETLEMGRVKTDEKKQEYYSTIVKESERLTRLINNILDFSKMEAGKKQYNFQQGDINALVEAVMNTYSFHLQSGGFEPIVQLADDLPMIRIDPEAATEAVINLVDNAVKYSGERKFLAVRTLKTDAMLAVEVRDHGVGIAEEHRKKIFDTFYRVGTALVHNTKGSGLGLSLVKHIMDAHGGRVEVDSVVGEGSTFRLLFPIGPAPTGTIHKP